MSNLGSSYDFFYGTKTIDNVTTEVKLDLPLYR